jgi:hypothetical protein
MCMYQTRIYCFAAECFGPNWSSSGEMANWGRTFSLYPWPKAKFGMDFPVMPFGLTSSPKIVAVNANLDIYVRIFRICSEFCEIRYKVWACVSLWTAVLLLLSRNFKQRNILKLKNALVNAFQCVKERPPYLKSRAYIPYVPQ